ncbi:hypothetical protein TrVFT333_003814 [Trichoderma virens FT-333]|nr:hypothetical protein TrVFT333_003814 [Trichoderma virens FT-333]
MDPEKTQDDATSAGSFTVYTPHSGSTTSDQTWEYNYAVPWPGGVYRIINKTSDKAITLANGHLCLQETNDPRDEYSHWLCVEANGYFGFFNQKANKYIGHDGEWGMRAWAERFLDWEYFTPRRHPAGGYQLLSPFYHHTLRELAVANGGKKLIRRDHGITLWEFVKVSEY